MKYKQKTPLKKQQASHCIQQLSYQNVPVRNNIS